MDPVSLALTLLLKNPGVATSAIDKATAPAAVDVSKMQGSFADLSRGVLQCYHKTGRFINADYVGSPWKRQAQYAADNSMVVRIRYTGVSTMPYEMVVAVMAKDNKVRTAVLADTATIPYNKKCQLEDWTGA
jgi:hypothetical protein